eukprot:227193-Pleurochrysis_carterae.AAC.1
MLLPTASGQLLLSPAFAFLHIYPTTSSTTSNALQHRNSTPPPRPPACGEPVSLTAAALRAPRDRLGRARGERRRRRARRRWAELHTERHRLDFVSRACVVRSGGPRPYAPSATRLR